MSEPAAYFYTVIRVMPRVERGECFNAGVVLFSRSLRYLGMRWALDPWKLQALSSATDPDFVESQLVAMAAVALGIVVGRRGGRTGDSAPAPSRTTAAEVARQIAALDHVYATPERQAGPGGDHYRARRAALMSRLVDEMAVEHRGTGT